MGRTPFTDDQPCCKASTYTEETHTDIHVWNGIVTHYPYV